MGLESRITHVLENAPATASDLRLGYDYWFDNGLICKDLAAAVKVITQLNKSDEFSKQCRAEENTANGEVKIVFHGPRK